MGGCQNYGPFLGTLTIRCRIIIRIQTGTIILTTTHISLTRWLEVASRTASSDVSRMSTLKLLPGKRMQAALHKLDSKISSHVMTKTCLLLDSAF